ncbi:hypothetical protein [Ethanoligenens harbinense]|nr:hypothetical protein [Ethanoligenens harbinense]AVQ95256.1 hypothetical protein CXQ68_02745 [Ethanoligenens harbinense YUAN-3]AYF40667.1 hypothetical protein CN246_02745 [Ethanoligenens harbinense]QCN91501.1 hypothetical protein DRA42_02755 [Ethanoligenens harbinense]
MYFHDFPALSESVKLSEKTLEANDNEVENYQKTEKRPMGRYPIERQGKWKIPLVTPGRKNAVGWLLWQEQA